jgi:hypothetical protein
MDVAGCLCRLHVLPTDCTYNTIDCYFVCHCPLECIPASLESGVGHRCPHSHIFVFDRMYICSPRRRSHRLSDTISSEEKACTRFPVELRSLDVWVTPKGTRISPDSHCDCLRSYQLGYDNRQQAAARSLK